MGQHPRQAPRRFVAILKSLGITAASRAMVALLFSPGAAVLAIGAASVLLAQP